MEERYLEIVKKKAMEVAMTSLQVAEVTGKEHAKVIRDIEDESSKLGVEISQAIFGESDYTNERGKTYKMYNLSRDGAMQLGARYDAITRYKMIQRINELEAQVARPSYMIEDPIERAKIWIAEKEEKKKLQLELEAKKEEVTTKDKTIAYKDRGLNIRLNVIKDREATIVKKDGEINQKENDIIELRKGQFKSIALTNVVKKLKINGLTTMILNEWFQYKGFGKYEVRVGNARRFYPNDTFIKYVVNEGFAKTREGLESGSEHLEYNCCIVDRLNSQHRLSIEAFMINKQLKKAF
ncbi:MAG: Rha family transcriptional regulator [Fusobacteriaceae bacterium]